MPSTSPAGGCRPGSSVHQGVAVAASTAACVTGSPPGATVSLGPSSQPTPNQPPALQARPLHARPLHARPVQTAPDQKSADQARPLQARPDQASELQVAPVQASPPAPDQARPDQARPDQARPDQLSSDQARPDQSVPKTSNSPSRAMPSRTTRTEPRAPSMRARAGRGLDALPDVRDVGLHRPVDAQVAVAREAGVAVRRAVGGRREHVLDLVRRELRTGRQQQRSRARHDRCGLRRAAAPDEPVTDATGHVLGVGAGADVAQAGDRPARVR